MKKLLGIVVLGLLWCSNTFALPDRAICLGGGECDFVMGNLYEHAIINCQWTIKEDVFVWSTNFSSYFLKKIEKKFKIFF